MEINYELTPEDFYNFSKENAPSQSTHKPMVTIFLTVYFMFIFADVFYVLLFGSSFDWKMGDFFISVLLRTGLTFGAVVLLLGLFKLFSKFSAKKAVKEEKNGLFCEHRIILTEDELIELTDINTCRYSWRAIGEIKELENFVSIAVQMSGLFVIPKRNFSDQKQIQTFLATAKQYQQNSKDNFQLSHFIEYEKQLDDQSL